MEKFLKNSAGFTLLELILVIAILSILSMVAIAAIDPLTQFKKATDAKVKSDLAQIQRALESYYEDNGKYPAYTNTGTPYLIKDLSGNAVSWGGSFAPFMNFLPVPPGSSKYIYYSSPDGQVYFIYANLGVSSDPSSCKRACTGASGYSNAPNTTTACGTPSLICNYGVSSPNVSP